MGLSEPATQPPKARATTMGPCARGRDSEPWENSAPAPSPHFSMTRGYLLNPRLVLFPKGSRRREPPHLIFLCGWDRVSVPALWLRTLEPDGWGREVHTVLRGETADTPIPQRLP